MNTLMPRILRLDAGGLPIDWISLQSAVGHYAQGEVLWEAGRDSFLMRGGINAMGVRSVVRVYPIVATASPHRSPQNQTPTLTNAALFARDRYVCLYCGNRFPAFMLSRDHVIPRAQGGPDAWDNTASACKRCNGLKGARTPEQAGMPLIALPYTPSTIEALILRNRNILADQSDYLSRMVPARDERWQ